MSVLSTIIIIVVVLILLACIGTAIYIAVEEPRRMQEGLDWIKNKTYNTIEIDVKKIDGEKKISVGIFGEAERWIGWIKNPVDLVVGENRFFTDVAVTKITIQYKDGGDIFLDDVKYNGNSIMTTGSGRTPQITNEAKRGTLLQAANYDYTVV